MWVADYGVDGELVWDGDRAKGWGRVWRAFQAFDGATPPGALEKVGGGYPSFPWGNDRETDLMVFTGNYVPSAASVTPAFSGDYKPVRDRVFPGTPEGAFR